ncbi:hypothetical protein GA840_10520 [Pediococcus ethanolidurans]|uniref:hypothetical protein n=1 Tax=Pediococcus ethanolidurans TaxID=319653 RepID=UPI00295535E6|nr:hypothetical protein [Pediococcus ethanolidurans]MDV7720257.1 hypothetical protein [Pediococcus ethanolidurans]
MCKYGVQIVVYTQYFMKVIRDMPGVLVYTICLPLVFLAINVGDAFFKPLTLDSYVVNVMPYVGWMIFSNCVTTAGNIASLREQGYLKQYRTLIVNPSVFIVSQALVNLVLILSTLLLVAVLSSWVFKLGFLSLLGQLWLTLVLVYLPVTCYSLPLIALAWRLKTIDTAINGLSLLVILGTFAVNTLLTVHASNPVLNLISPIYLVNNVFAMLTVVPINHFIGTYSLILVLFLALGWFSYRHIKLLPTEGL